MIFGQKMKLIIITIIKHHNSKHYIHSIFINTYDNYPCLLKKYRLKISRMLTKHFRSELFDDSAQQFVILSHAHREYIQVNNIRNLIMEAENVQHNTRFKSTNVCFFRLSVFATHLLSGYFMMLEPHFRSTSKVQFSVLCFECLRPVC